MSPRAQLVAILRAGVPTGWDVRDYNSDDLGNLTTVTVTVQTTELAAPITFTAWTATVVVDVVAPQERYAAAEATLEGALVDVVDVLTEAVSASTITGAERIVRAEKHHAWRFTLTLPLKTQEA